ncbi:hypothetical protein [Spirochaeta africana]|uniref:Uncharacterized protein n=1 Tax=Spirochaeta africana (strain ATCC 700263 / DSM 8902 / Z-7692) TaxID=889378 RepID=H9UI64_SPIAZ|nr:hypothetical protein [Spirochaeta africana]AFG37207.1 hypothetical protein Spiaf_1120 [Spirochaeta africana DSM 8902]AFG37212.1 hypothetical protein Spiaf_1126 [Spirochaeta africana DSM 8902]
MTTALADLAAHFEHIDTAHYKDSQIFVFDSRFEGDHQEPIPAEVFESTVTGTKRIIDTWTNGFGKYVLLSDSLQVAICLDIRPEAEHEADTIAAIEHVRPLSEFNNLVAEAQEFADENPNHYRTFEWQPDFYTLFSQHEEVRYMLEIVEV